MHPDAPSCNARPRSRSPAARRPGRSAWRRWARPRPRRRQPTTRRSSASSCTAATTTRNTLVPYDTTSYNKYFGMRPTLAYTQAQLAPTLLVPSVALAGGRQYALAPELAPLLRALQRRPDGRDAQRRHAGPADDQGAVHGRLGAAAAQAVLAQRPAVGTGNRSRRKARRRAGAGAWATCFVAGNGNATFTCVNVSGQRGVPLGQHGGAVPGRDHRAGRVQRAALQRHAKPVRLDRLRGGAAVDRHGAAQRICSRTSIRASPSARSTPARVLTAALASAPTIATPFPSGNALADQLKFVARMISTATATSTKRQVFFVSIGGFDTHDGLAAVHPGLLTTVADAMNAFYQATVELGVADPGDDLHRLRLRPHHDRRRRQRPRLGQHALHARRRRQRRPLLRHGAGRRQRRPRRRRPGPHAAEHLGRPVRRDARQVVRHRRQRPARRCCRTSATTTSASATSASSERRRRRRRA